MTTKKKPPAPAKPPPKKKAAAVVAPTRPPRKPLTIEEKVDRLVFLLVKGKWSRDKARTTAKAWGVTKREISRMVERASIKIEIAGGKLTAHVSLMQLELEAITGEARKAGNFSAAVRAIEMRAKLAGAFAAMRPGRHLADGEGDSPAGLPPELAKLTPPPSYDEVSHFAEVAPDACAVNGCRVHQPKGPLLPPAAVQ